MSATDAQKKATTKYLSQLDETKIRFKKGEKEKISEFAKSKGMSLNAYINNLIEKDMKNDV